MSIIYEALKKVEQKNNFSEPQIPSESNSKPEQIISPAKNKNIFLLPAIFFVTLALLLIFIYVLRYRGSEAKLASAGRKLMPPVARRKIKPVSSKKALISEDEIKEAYILEGIVYDQKDPFAIINGRVFRNYDRLDNFMIVDITEKTVQIANVENKKRTTLDLAF